MKQNVQEITQNLGQSAAANLPAGYPVERESARRRTTPHRKNVPKITKMYIISPPERHVVNIVFACSYTPERQQDDGGRRRLPLLLRLLAAAAAHAETGS